MRVWITGTQPGADKHAAALEAAGYEALVAPVLEIRALRPPLPEGPFDTVVFLSEHAVTHGAAVDCGGGTRVLAVGAATAAALAARGVTAEYPERAGSEGLLDLLMATAPRRVLIVAGEAGRKMLRESLETAGVEVREFLCYRRQPAAVSVPEPAGVDAILVASQDGFRHVARVWFDSGGSPDVTVIAASERVAEPAQTLGFRRVRVAGGATAPDWLAALDVVRGGR